MSESLSIQIGEWLDTALDKIMLFATTLPVEISFIDPSAIPCLKITRWGTKVTAAVGTSDLRDQSEACQGGVLNSKYKNGAISIVFIEDTLKNTRADKLVGLPHYASKAREITKNQLMKDVNEMGQANEIAIEALVQSLRSFLYK